jgi:hypothetical protein
MSGHSQIGVPVRVFDAETADDLGIAHVPFPVELGDKLAVEAYSWPFEIVDAIPTRIGGRPGALVEVRHAALHAV